MDSIREGRLLVCLKKKSKFEWFNKRNDKNHKNLKFKEYSVRLWRENVGKAHLDLLDLNDGDRPISTVDMSSVDGVRRITNIANKEYCFRVLCPSSTVDPFLAARNETDLHAWMADILSLHRRPLIPTGVNAAYPVYLISVSGPSSSSSSLLDPSVGPDLWICLESEEIKFYSASALKFLTRLSWTDIRSCRLVVDGHPNDATHVLEIEATFFNESSNSKTGDNGDERLRTVRLFSTNARELLLELRSINDRSINCGEMKNIFESKMTMRFKKVASKSVENLNEKNFSIGRLNCLSSRSNNSPPNSPGSDRSDSASSGASSSNSAFQQPRTSALPSKEELERRENEKLVERAESNSIVVANGGEYKILRHSLSKSVDNLRGAGLSVAHRISPISKDGPPPLPPRKRDGGQLESNRLLEKSGGYDILSSTANNRLLNGDYKLLGAQSTGNPAYPTYSRLPDRSELFLNLTSGRKAGSKSTVDGKYKILSPSSDYAANDRLKRTPLRSTHTTDGYDISPDLKTPPPPLNRYDVIRSSTTRSNVRSGYDVLSAVDRRKTPVVLSPETEV